MAQWNGQFSGLTHETKVKDIEASLRSAIAAFDGAVETERTMKAKAVRRLAERLLSARVKALHARLSVLRKPGATQAESNHFAQLLAREKELEAHGVTRIFCEFHIGDFPVSEL